MKLIGFYISALISMNIVCGQLNNLQVLEFDSKRELKNYMKTISKDLGVKCTFCHDINDKSIETDHKIIAREMIKMQMDLNKQFFSE